LRLSRFSQMKPTYRHERGNPAKQAQAQIDLAELVKRRW
jgi:hypothetical protein